MRFIRAIGAVGAWTALAAGMLACGCRSRSGVPGDGGLWASASSGVVLAPMDDSTTYLSPDALREMGLRRYWRSALSLVAGDRVQQVRLLDGQLIVLTQKNMVYAVDAARGSVHPLVQIASEKAGEFAMPTFDGVRYFFAGMQKAVGIHAAAGIMDVDIKLKMPARTRAISDKEFVYVGGLDGRIFAYSITSQVAHWNSKYGPAVTSLGFSRGQLIAARSDIGIRKARGALLSIRPKLWVDNWEQFTEGPITAPIVCTEDAVFVASEDGSLYRFNAEHGWPEWQVRTPGVLVDAPLVLSDRIVQLVPGTGTWVLRRAQKEILWKDPAKLHYLGTAEDRMYFFDGEKLICKHADTGKALGAAAIHDAGNILPVANLDGTRLYLVHRGGAVICCNDLGQPYLVIGK